MKRIVMLLGAVFILCSCNNVKNDTDNIKEVVENDNKNVIDSSYSENIYTDDIEKDVLKQEPQNSSSEKNDVDTINKVENEKNIDIQEEFEQKDSSTETSNVTTVIAKLNNSNQLALYECTAYENTYVYEDDKFLYTTCKRTYIDSEKAKEAYNKLITGFQEYEDVKLNENILSFTLKAENDKIGAYSRFSKEDIINMLKSEGYICEVK